MKETMPTETDLSARWTLIRDIAALQAKLLVDGLRDLVLLPASLIVGLFSLVSSQDGKPGDQFYRLLAIGKQTEHWINLFGALRNAPPDIDVPDTPPDSDIDQLLARVETFVVDEHNRGGMTAQARKRFDNVLDALQRRNKRGQK
jgi:hypothetical protein